MDTTKIVEKIKYGNIELKLKTENLQEKTVNPSTEVQTILPDHEYGGMSSVVVTAVTSDIDANIIPDNIKEGVTILGVNGSLGELKGEILITDNGIHDVRNYASANVNVPMPDLSQTTATADDVLEGKEFYNASGEKVAGTYKDMLQQILDARDGEYLFYALGFSGLSDIIKNLNTTNLTTMRYMFGNWTKEMGYTSLDLSNMNVSNVTTMAYCFYNSTGLRNVDLTGWDTSKVTTMAYMFSHANMDDGLNVEHFNTSNVTNMEGMFYCGVPSLDLSEWDVSKVINMKNMFQDCRKLTNLNLTGWDTISLTSMSTMFYNCVSLPNVDVGHLNTSKVKDMSFVFANCPALTSLNLSEWDTSNVTTLENMFYQCKALTSLNLNDWDTSNVTNWYHTFQNCEKLVEILGELDLINTTNVNNTFSNCKALTTVTLKNIKISLQIGSGTSYGHLLTLDTLLNTIKELHTNTTTSTRKLTMGTANTAKLADVYVKLIEITDEMRAEDPYIDNKAPFVQCESTDEGAMLITEYVTTVKKWQLA